MGIKREFLLCLYNRSQLIFFSTMDSINIKAF